jgi:selenocysteine lyase/cysteine desulfurase
LSEEENKFISLRFSFSFYNTVKEVDYVISELKELLNK